MFSLREVIIVVVLGFALSAWLAVRPNEIADESTWYQNDEDSCGGAGYFELLMDDTNLELQASGADYETIERIRNARSKSN